MENKNIKISVCLVVYNEEKIIGRCLDSIKDLADEIILVHDGECADKTLEIARRYTDQIFVRPHMGDSSLHRVFTYNQAKGEWIFQIDADEYIDNDAIQKIKELINNAAGTNINGYRLQWEMWNGKEAFYVSGFQKEILFKKRHFHYLAIPHGFAYVDGVVKNAGIRLHHRPLYNNLSWKSMWKKMQRWIPKHVDAYFPTAVGYDGFQITSEKWEKFTAKVRRYPLFYLVKEPLKMTIGQMRNGLWRHWAGWCMLGNQFVYYLYLYWRIWKKTRKLKLL